MPKTRQSCNNRWGWRFLPSPLKVTEPEFFPRAVFCKETERSEA